MALNTHFVDRNAFYTALNARCERRQPQLTQYELYYCGPMFIPDPSGLGRPLEILAVEQDGAWRQRGWVDGLGPPPVSPEIGWSSAPGATGRLSITVAIPEGVREVALPIAINEGAEQVSFVALDEFGAELAALRTSSNSTTWKLWRIDIPASLQVRTLRIEVNDRSSGREQWAAVGAPWSVRALRNDADVRAISLSRLLASAVGGALPAELIEENAPNGDPIPAIFAHASMDLSADLPRGSRQLIVNFGMRAPSYRTDLKTKGVCFSVAAGDDAREPREIWRRCLRPAEEVTDRGMQEATIPLDARTRRIVLRTRPAVAGDLTWGWSYWADPRTRQ